MCFLGFKFSCITTPTSFSSLVFIIFSSPIGQFHTGFLLFFLIPLCDIS
ncbi:hypothetical protein E2C01_090545 [Portunus trituberculatus]|uniref:Uncharacterized protein n=1 Tax=Portunus trituberculatus TaxID=210409 RepID=A0A5B7JQM4_PORTR|nr:hypothetical protein [Portunus trituberculatus]